MIVWKKMKKIDRKVYRNKHYKIVIEQWEDLLIQVYWKGQLLMSAISENESERNDDIVTVNRLIKDKCVRRWFNKHIILAKRAICDCKVNKFYNNPYNFVNVLSNSEKEEKVKHY